MSKVTFKATCLQKGEDAISGFKGTINAVCEQFHGGRQYSLKPPVGDDNKMPEGHWVDEGLLKMPSNLPDEEKALTSNAYFTQQTVDFAYEIGDKVACVLSGYEGRVATRALWADGCILYMVTPKHNPKEKFDCGTWFNEAELKLLKSGFSITQKVEPRRTGGITTSSEINRY